MNGFNDRIKRKRSGTGGNNKIITKKGIQDNRWQDGTDGNSKLPLTGLASTWRQTTERRRRGDTWTIITKKCSEIKKLTRNRTQATRHNMFIGWCKDATDCLSGTGRVLAAAVNGGRCQPPWLGSRHTRVQFNFEVCRGFRSSGSQGTFNLAHFVCLCLCVARWGQNA